MHEDMIETILLFRKQEEKEGAAQLIIQSGFPFME